MVSDLFSSCDNYSIGSIDTVAIMHTFAYKELASILTCLDSRSYRIYHGLRMRRTAISPRRTASLSISLSGAAAASTDPLRSQHPWWATAAPVATDSPQQGHNEPNIQVIKVKLQSIHLQNDSNPVRLKCFKSWFFLNILFGMVRINNNLKYDPLENEDIKLCS